MIRNQDPHEVLNRSPMTQLQVLIIGITVGLNALDGFDILSISFASPGIAAEWGINRTALGVVLSMELVGMALGSFLLGGVADRLGRRRTILGCLLVMAIGMLMATTTRNVTELSIWRVVTGLGIGGMLAATNAVAAEFSNNKRRHLCISLMAIGYPLGGVVGGALASQLLAGYEWRAVFYFGSAITAAFIPVVYFVMPESVFWLIRRQPASALEQINKTFGRLGHTAISALPKVSSEARNRLPVDIFSHGLLWITIIVTAAYFLHITTFYFVLKWVPKIVADLGFANSSAASVLVWVNVGGALGGALFGLLTMKYELKRLAAAVLLLAGMFVAIFGRSPSDLASLSLFGAMAGFFSNAGVVGLYALAAQAFPTHARAFGTGFVIGFGRGGAVLSPILAGVLFDSGMVLPAVAMVMGVGSVVGAVVLLFLRLNTSELPPEGSSEDEADKQRSFTPSVA